jgi:predicted ATPase
LSTVLDMVSPGGARLVTVTGLPGMGKSRFALAVAGALHTRSRVAVLWRYAGNQRLTGDGSWPAGSDHLSETVRDRLDGLVRDSAGAGSALCAVIAQAPTLLVLDGFGGADVWRDRLVALLQECPRLRALIIAERGTGLPWERVVPLAPLAIPGPALEQAASIRFLFSRVRQVRPDFRVTEENSPDLGRLACQVDGIPVALEAIAFLLGLYQPGQLSELIVDDPLAFLTATGAAPGVRRLRDGLASALDALDPVRRSQLRGLASTRSGWSVPEAAELLGVSPAVGARFIGELLVSGLIRPDEATQSRYRVLSVVRTALRS